NVVQEGACVSGKCQFSEYAGDVSCFMNCECTEKVSQLIDGELSEAEARAMQRHVNECRECQQAREDFLSLRSQIANYVPAVSPASQADALARTCGRKLQVVA